MTDEICVYDVCWNTESITFGKYDDENSIKILVSLGDFYMDHGTGMREVQYELLIH